MMEELFVVAFLLCEEMAAEDEYRKRLDELFLGNIADDGFL